MNFATSVSTCLSKFFNAKGRASRSEYWWFYLLAIGVALANGLFDSTVLALAYYASVIPVFTAGIRRMHDTGRSGWFLWVPFANLYWMVQPSAPGENKYGPVPEA